MGNQIETAIQAAAGIGLMEEAGLGEAAAGGELAALCRLQMSVHEAGNAATARKFGQLLEKAEKEMTAIAFCGHFSAGKSTLINRLCGQPLLPSSPIPTSANLVSICSGEPGAEVTRRVGVSGRAGAEGWQGAGRNRQERHRDGWNGAER